MTVDPEQAVAAAIARYRDVHGGLLPLLRAVQEELGYIPPGSVAEIASALDLSRAEVHGVISFYHDFRTAPAGRHTLQLCRAEACQAVGSRALEQHVQTSLGIDFGDTTADGMVTLEPVYCLGNCACSPSLRLDDAIHGRVDAARLDQLLSELREADSQ
jgi:formate dehydrogenase subunit gamma